jgi:hypothetical protein
MATRGCCSWTLTVCQIWRQYVQRQYVLRLQQEGQYKEGATRQHGAQANCSGE